MHARTRALIVLATLLSAASVEASSPEARGALARTRDEISAVIIATLERCSFEDAHVTVILEHRRHEIRISGRDANRCSPRFRGLVAEPPPGARIFYELEVVRGRARVLRAHTTNTPQPAPHRARW